MMGRVTQTSRCGNMNHRRSDAPLSHCPECGGVVNAAIRPQPCNDAQHAAARRQQNVFCVNCGTQLILSR